MTFEETNVVGNVYYVNHLRWQGFCREMFIRDHAPGMLSELSKGLNLVTVRCSCNYFAEVFAFDNIVIRMRLADTTQNRLTMLFEYVRQNSSGEEVVATGEQQVACMRREGNQTIPVPIPAALLGALRQYSE